MFTQQEGHRYTEGRDCQAFEGERGLAGYARQVREAHPEGAEGEVNGLVVRPPRGHLLAEVGEAGLVRRRAPQPVCARAVLAPRRVVLGRSARCDRCTVVRLLAAFEAGVDAARA